jgi:hypothetical protein
MASTRCLQKCSRMRYRFASGRSHDRGRRCMSMSARACALLAGVAAVVLAALNGNGPWPPM